MQRKTEKQGKSDAMLAIDNSAEINTIIFKHTGLFFFFYVRLVLPSVAKVIMNFKGLNVKSD